MTTEHFINKLRYIFDEYFNDDEKMWDYIYDCCMTEFYKNRIWKLKAKVRRKKYESQGKRWMENKKSQDRKAVAEAVQD